MIPVVQGPLPASLSSKQVAAIEHAVSAAQHDAVTPEVSIAVSINGVIVYSKAYHSVTLPPSPGADVDTPFYMGSLTKQFVAVAILRFYGEGLVDLDAPVSRYLAAFSEMPTLTVRNLLRQTSGLAEYNTAPFIIHEADYAAPDQSRLFHAIAASGLRFTPGSKFEYCNTNYLLLGAIVERLSHKSLQAYFQQAVLQPLGLHHTAFMSSALKRQQTAKGYLPVYLFPIAMPATSSAWSAGAGSLISTPTDLLYWSTALLAGRIIPKRLVSLLTTPYKGNYAFGFVTAEARHYKSLWHNGESSNTHSMLITFAEQHLSIAVVGNSYSFPAESVAGSIARIIEPTLPPRDKTLLQRSTTFRDGLTGLFGLATLFLSVPYIKVSRKLRNSSVVAGSLLFFIGMFAPLGAGIVCICWTLAIVLSQLLTGRLNFKCFR